MAPSDSSKEAGLAEHKSTCPSAALHLELKDGTGMSVPVELFHACLEGADRRCSHMIGIRETSTVPREMLVEAPAMINTKAQPTAKKASSPNSNKRTTVSRSGASSVNSGSSMATWIAEQTWERKTIPELAEVSICFDVLSEQLEVVDYTLHFAQRIVGTDSAGRSAILPDLVQWMNPQDAEQLRMWTHHQIRLLKQGKHLQRNQVELPIKVPFVGCTLIAKSILLDKGDIELDEEEPDEEDPCMPVKLRFTGFELFSETLQYRRKTAELQSIAEVDEGRKSGEL